MEIFGSSITNKIAPSRGADGLLDSVVFNSMFPCIVRIKVAFEKNLGVYIGTTLLVLPTSKNLKGVGIYTGSQVKNGVRGIILQVQMRAIPGVNSSSKKYIALHLSRKS